jgi:large-conductance mechanosensitive channel
MNLTTVITIIVLAAIVFFAVRYIVKSKKKGAKCIGCPVEGTCQMQKTAKKIEKSCCSHK